MTDSNNPLTYKYQGAAKAKAMQVAAIIRSHSGWSISKVAILMQKHPSWVRRYRNAAIELGFLPEPGPGPTCDIGLMRCMKPAIGRRHDELIAPNGTVRVSHVNICAHHKEVTITHRGTGAICCL